MSNASNMKKNPLAGIGRVYRFTLKQVCSAKGWLISTILIAVLLLVGIPLILLAAASDGTDSDDSTRIKQVLVCDETDGDADYNVLKEAGDYETVTYTMYKSMDEAAAAVTEKDTTVILRVTKPDESLMLTVYLPENSELSRSKASDFADFVKSC